MNNPENSPQLPPQDMLVPQAELPVQDEIVRENLDFIEVEEVSHATDPIAHSIEATSGAEQEMTDQQTGEVAIGGFARFVKHRRANSNERKANRIKKRADRLERKVAIMEHTHNIVSGLYEQPKNAGDRPALVPNIDVKTLSRKERKTILNTRVKVANAESARKKAELIALANGGRGRMPIVKKRSINRDLEDRALAGEISLDEMSFGKSHIKAGNGQVKINGEPLYDSKPVREVKRAQSRAATKRKQARLALDTASLKKRIEEKRKKEAKSRQKASEYRRNS